MKTRFVYIACPWGPWGGGMYKVVDYLVQAQHQVEGIPRFRVINTRGPGLITMPFVIMRAIVSVLYGAASGQMALLHVNLAHGLSAARKLALVYAASLAGAPTVVHVHAAKLQTFYAGLSPPLRALLRRAFRRPTCIIVLGEDARAYVVNVIGVDAQRVVTLTNGVPEPTNRPVPRAAGDPFRLLFLGSQFERKGLMDLMVGLSLPEVLRLDWRLTVAGGDEAQPFRLQAQKLGIEGRIQFVGWVDQRRVSELLARSDAMILPSYDEGLPLVILEALGHGVPVICTPVGEIPQFLTDRETALFVAPGRSDEIAQAVAELIGNPQLCGHLASAGRSQFRTHFSLEAFTRSLTAIYRRYCGLRSSDLA
jgi:glycosyltransferase involved in cell wall biosynthesis